MQLRPSGFVDVPKEVEVILMFPSLYENRCSGRPVHSAMIVYGTFVYAEIVSFCTFFPFHHVPGVVAGLDSHHNRMLLSCKDNRMSTYLLSCMMNGPESGGCVRLHEPASISALGKEALTAWNSSTSFIRFTDFADLGSPLISISNTDALPSSPIASASPSTLENAGQANRILQRPAEVRRVDSVDTSNVWRWCK